MAHEKGMSCVITIFLSRDVRNPVPEIEEYNELDEFVDYFNVMVYDYIQEDKHAPLDWAINTLKAFSSNSYIQPGKIILGIPFYGYIFSEKAPGPIVGPDYIKFLSQKQVPLFKWNPGQEEHTLSQQEYVDKSYQTRIINYPTIYVRSYDSNTNSFWKDV